VGFSLALSASQTVWLFSALCGDTGVGVYYRTSARRIKKVTPVSDRLSFPHFAHHMTGIKIMDPISGLNALKLIADASKLLGNIIPSAGKLQAELFTVRSQLVEAHQVALELQMAYATASQRVLDLEKEIQRHLDWTAELDRYDMIDIAPGRPAYGLKTSSQKAGEPMHYLCINCANTGKKSVLQRNSVGYQSVFKCFLCNAEVADGTPAFGHRGK